MICSSALAILLADPAEGRGAESPRFGVANTEVAVRIDVEQFDRLVVVDGGDAHGPTVAFVKAVDRQPDERPDGGRRHVFVVVGHGGFSLVCAGRAESPA